MSFNTKRATRKLSHTSIKSKSKNISEYTIHDLPSLRRKRTIALNPESTSLRSHIKLPKIQLPTFSGNIKQWPEWFIDTFNSLIHDCPSLTDVEKFQYLVSSLSGDPLSLIRKFPVTGDYYSDAYAALVARYQHKRELSFTCWKDILNVSFKLNNAIEFRRSLDCIDENLSILRKQDLPVENWDFILVHHILSKLDSKLRREFEEKYINTEIPEYSQLKEFLHSKCESLLRDNHFSEPSKTNKSIKESTSRTVASNSKYPSSNTYSKRPHVTHTLLTDNTNKVQIAVKNDKPILRCSLCSASHSITRCEAFLAKSVDDRMTYTIEAKLYFNCLKSSHQLKDCNSVFRCLKCKHKHHTLLHKDRNDNKSSIDKNSTDSKSVSLFVKGENSKSSTKLLNTTVLLATAIIQIRDSDGNYHSLRALFDTGSQNNFITRKAVQYLHLQPVSCETNINGLGGIAADVTGFIRCSIGSNNNPLFDLDMHVISNICGEQPIAKLNTSGWTHINSLPLADPGFDVPGPIDVLLGADVFAESLLTQRIKGNANQPLAINSVFGWLLLGRTPLVSSSLVQVSSKSDIELASAVQRFWEVDSVPQASSFTPEEILCEQAYMTDHYRDSSGRYGVRLPFKDNVEPVFEGSRDIALRRFHAIERRLSRDPVVHQQYCDFMYDYEKSGHMSEVSLQELSQGKFYIPHHCVIKPDSVTTKLRVVFDASAKDVKGISLNDTLLTGPKLQSNIVGVLLHYRIHAVVFMADIRQMYRQILVSNDHRDYQRIFWRSGPNQVLKEYRLNTVTYGVSSAPFLACRTIKQLAEDEGSKFPLAKQILSTDIYVDDIVTGCEDLTTALEAKSQIVKLFELGHFELRKWASNTPGLLSVLSQEECLLDSKSFSDEQYPTLKVLGLKWNPVSDSFLFDVSSSNRSCTKRVILSEIAKIFDPLGFLSPLTTQVKCLLQRLWILGISWDESPPDVIINVWKSFCDQLPAISELSIPRRLTFDSAISYELHGFCDSSELAYGAVIYLRILCADGSIHTRLLCAKARVAPLKRLSLPRLELCGAVMLADLTKFVLDTYQAKIPIDVIHLWSDSTVVLSWLRSHSSRWTTFVANRVSHIQDIIPAESWHHVASGDNPADVCSRGQLPYDLINNSLWWSGPCWLSKTSDRWPKNSTRLLTSDEEQVVRTEERHSAAKSHLYRIVGNQVLTFEELSTLFIQIESVLNSRPLCALSTDPNDLNALTPVNVLNSNYAAQRLAVLLHSLAQPIATPDPMGIPWESNLIG
ncbi:hypothetical protein ABMA28_002635 [Loxostege sticticalis]|uniref:Peptidase A2 domain-containing protein n=1 Tax=Loxostege sticticalis TaxID=481309 RepID=A0ABD0T1T5_LOXSC